MHVRHALTILAVEPLAESVAFYRAAFPWPPTVETPVYVELALPGGQRLGLYEREAFGRNTGRVPARVPAGERATDGTTLWSAALTRRMALPSGEVLWFARLQNATDRLAQSATSILTQTAPGKSPLPGRSLKVGVQLLF